MSINYGKNLQKSIEKNNKKEEQVKIKQKENENLAKLSIELDENKKVTKSILKNNVKNASEKYYYDYNTKKLKYTLDIVMEDIYGTKDVETLEIVL